MSNVPKSKRKKHDFETTRQMMQLRRDITEIAINDFGFDADRYQKMIDRYAEVRKDQPNIEATVAKMQYRHDSFYNLFIEDETQYILQVWRDIVREFEAGNSIFPSGESLMEEFCASRKGKGISEQRKNFEKDLHNYFLAHGGNDGYIGFLDLSKYYDNIRHDIVKQLVYPLIPEDTHWLMDEILSSMEVDVSYMTEEEYRGCMNAKFDSTAYFRTVPEEAKTGEKMMPKSFNIGDQVSQNIGLYFPTRIDNYCKIVRGLKYYGRYMDDIYFITETREQAESIIEGVIKCAEELGLFVNQRKTRIVRLSDHFMFLQYRYSLTETGKVIVRVNPKTITRERRKLKAYRRLLERGLVPYEDIENAYKSWMGNYAKLMSKRQRKNIIALYQNLIDGRNHKWKK